MQWCVCACEENEDGIKEWKEKTHKTIREAMARKATEVCVRVKETGRQNAWQDKGHDRRSNVVLILSVHVHAFTLTFEAERVGRREE